MTARTRPRVNCLTFSWYLLQHTLVTSCFSGTQYQVSVPGMTGVYKMPFPEGYNPGDQYSTILPPDHQLQPCNGEGGSPSSNRMKLKQSFEVWFFPLPCVMWDIWCADFPFTLACTSPLPCVQKRLTNSLLQNLDSTRKQKMQHMTDRALRVVKDLSSSGAEALFILRPPRAEVVSTCHCLSNTYESVLCGIFWVYEIYWTNFFCVCCGADLSICAILHVMLHCFRYGRIMIATTHTRTHTHTTNTPQVAHQCSMYSF